MLYVQPLLMFVILGDAGLKAGEVVGMILGCLLVLGLATIIVVGFIYFKYHMHSNGTKVSHSGKRISNTFSSITSGTNTI